MTTPRGLRPLALLGAWLLATLAALPAMASRPAFDRHLDQALEQVDVAAELAAPAAAAEPDPRFGLLLAPPYPDTRFRALGPQPLHDIVGWSHILASADGEGRAKTRVRAFELRLSAQHQAIEEFGLEIVVGSGIYLDPELGRFLSEDPFAGMADQPPSLHRYLYGYANPTVYWDPDGRITALVEAAKWLRARRADVIELSKAGVSDSAEQSLPERALYKNRALQFGGAGGALGLASQVVGAANFVVDAGLIELDRRHGIRLGRFTEEAYEEADEAFATAASVAQAVVEDPMGVGAELALTAYDEATRLGSGLLGGDLGAIAETSAIATEFLPDLVAGTKGLGATARSVGRFARNARALVRDVASLGDDIADLAMAGLREGLEEGAVQAPRLDVPAVAASKGSTRPRTAGHHTIPQYMGGRPDQTLVDLAQVEVHNPYHEFLDNWRLPDGMQPRSPAPRSFRGPVRPWGRENPYLSEFAAESRDNRQFIVENLRQSYEEFGIYDEVADVFEEEVRIFLEGTP